MGISIGSPTLSWKLSLRSANRSPMTLRSYLDAVERLRKFLEANGMPLDIGRIQKGHIEAFIADQMETCSPAAATVRYRSLQQFFKWAVEEDELDDSPMRKMKAPNVPERTVPVIAEDEI